MDVNKSKKLSKRYSLARLPSGWREVIWGSIQSERLKLAVAVITATGCRPSELEIGVMVLSREGKLCIAIQGTKIDENTHRGQPLRIIHIDDATPWGAFLSDRVTAAGGRLVISYDAEGVSQRLREKSRELWPRRSTLVSAYSYRHFVGKSMKESNVPPVQIAAALGHASDFAQTAYGHAGRSRKTAGAHGVIASVTRNPVRHSPKLEKLNRFIYTHKRRSTNE